MCQANVYVMQHRRLYRCNSLLSSVHRVLYLKNGKHVACLCKAKGKAFSCLCVARSVFQLNIPSPDSFKFVALQCFLRGFLSVAGWFVFARRYKYAFLEPTFFVEEENTLRRQYSRCCVGEDQQMTIS